MEIHHKRKAQPVMVFKALFKGAWFYLASQCGDYASSPTVYLKTDGNLVEGNAVVANSGNRFSVTDDEVVIRLEASLTVIPV